MEKEKSPELHEGIRLEVINNIRLAENIIKVEIIHAFADEEGIDPQNVFDEVICDFDKSPTEEEKQYVTKWLEKQLGSPLEEAPILARCADSSTTVTVFAKEFADEWHFLRWEEEGKGPLYVFLKKEACDVILETAGLHKIEE